MCDLPSNICFVIYTCVSKLKAFNLERPTASVAAATPQIRSCALHWPLPVPSTARRPRSGVAPEPRAATAADRPTSGLQGCPAAMPAGKTGESNDTEWTEQKWNDVTILILFQLSVLLCRGLAQRRSSFKGLTLG
jgi:hypothetical protein